MVVLFSITLKHTPEASKLAQYLSINTYFKLKLKQPSFKMFFTKTLALLIAAAAPLSLAAPANGTEIQADFWAQFCDDTSCSQNCGESVKVSDPGCLNEGGRKSILFHGDENDGDYAFVVSSGGNCPCQSTCTSVPHNTNCWDISQYSGDQSFRFVGGSCGSNNC
ncbi:uncharacterized protein F4822DRAFT_445480 [Hypoxylon trugodes]|uniref:uncharacterized protein n=1 Tax=Hypoxylon trugodes TaxID=326681 RepID=UPI00218E5683|nr:uncharacterized protein F4822DRAFT_445480 [Hypoxylon trugodes]KAI1385523.1 hypothetical protein F4822DRAFT_445480 [Hypoxylon trugodes]